MTAPVETYQPSTGRPLRLRRSWPRGDGRLLLEYVRGDGATVAGQWFADPARLDRVAAQTPRPAEVVPGTGVLLQPAGADRRLPAVQRLLRRPGSTLVAHRPERRAVVRLAEGHAKVTRAGRAARYVEPAPGPHAFTLPRLLRDDPSTGTSLWETLPGRTLHEAGADESWLLDDLRAAWAAVGRGLRALHETPVDDAFPHHDAKAEHATTSAWLAAATRYGLLPPLDAGPSPAPACVRPCGPRGLAPLRDCPAGPRGLLHRDLHDKQLLLQPDGRIGLVDLDTLAVGERALDIANVLAHLELRTSQGALTTHRAAAAWQSFLTGYAADAATLARVPAHVTAARLRLRAVYAFRPARPASRPRRPAG